MRLITSGCVFALAFSAVASIWSQEKEAAGKAARTQSAKNLRKIGLAMYAYTGFEQGKIDPLPTHVIYSKDGKTPMGMDDWLTSIKPTAPHLFVGSTGSGAGGGNRHGAPDMTKMTPAQKIQMGIEQGGLLKTLPGA